MEKSSILEDMILEAACKVDQIGAIALCATEVSCPPEKCQQLLNGVLFGIENLSKLVSDELGKISEEVSAL